MSCGSSSHLEIQVEMEECSIYLTLRQKKYKLKRNENEIPVHAELIRHEPLTREQLQQHRLLLYVLCYQQE